MFQPRITVSNHQCERPEKRDWKGHLLCILEAEGECGMGPHKRVIMEWTQEMRSRPEVSVERW